MFVLLFLVILVVLVVAHEFGHFIVAKKAGIRVDEFAFGFPPRLFSIKKGETRYSFNALPLGGYVKIYGENPGEVDAQAHDKKRSFTAQHRGIQSAVIVAGIVFNLLLAWILISAALMIGVPSPVDGAHAAYVTNSALSVVEVRTGSPAERAGLTPGDAILSLGDGVDQVNTPSTPEQVSGFIGPREGKEILFSFRHGDETKTVSITPVSGIVPDHGAIGIAMETLGTLRLPPHLALWEGAKQTVQLTQMTAVGLYKFFRQIIVGKPDFSQVTGPVGIVNSVGSAAGLGAGNLLFFVALISINLAVINIIPFPALDGGRLLFVIIEAIMRKPIKAVVANTFNIVGFALLMLLMVLVTYHDVVKLF
jgi:regulator of sigma E protease